MDNPPFNKSNIMMNLYDELNINIVFGAPYSPDFNPNELFFNRLKTNLFD